MVKADEVEEVTVHALAAVMIFTKLTGERRAPFVENARQQNITAQPHARTARRALGQIGSGIVEAHDALILEFRFQIK